MDVHNALQQSALRRRLALLLLASTLVLALSPFVGSALSPVEAIAGRPGTNPAEIAMASPPPGEAFVLIQGQGLAGEASVTGSNGTNVNIVGNDTVNSNAAVSGAPLGKTVIRADVGVVLNYPQMCNIYVMVFHPSNAMWFHAWNGNQHACTANLNQQWIGIHDFDYADINGLWHLSVQETAGLSQGYIDSWFIKLYYQVDSTPTPTRTAAPSVRRQLLPVIVSEL